MAVLEPLPGNTFAVLTGLTDDGVAYGYSSPRRTSPVSTAVRWGLDGVPVALPIPPGALGTSLHGVAGRTAFGSATDTPGLDYPVRWDLTNTTVTVLDTTGFRFTSLQAANRRGEVIGGGLDNSSIIPVLRWNRSGHRDSLAPLPGQTQAAGYAINDSGTVVGTSSGYRSGDRPVRWSADGAVTELPTAPGTTFDIPHAINERGTIAGRGSTDDDNHWTRALIWVTT
ncbi:putative membrane protein [Actinokineospora baliensis]|uniref:hypothetical protein n=1 Tax=Actinokineospora baliensis TaxID=547056 RepID=UPI001957E3F7|nr:hypothetical protein [Actinokineospora baliensis]MBM7774082.1 putative membrane protein [Actinokineospora baliensis]